MNNNFLGFKELYNLCDELRFSQGFYGRLFRQLQEMSDEDRDELNTIMLAQNFKDTLDIILWLEC